MRFAARESAIFAQPEAGLGTPPGAGAIQHLTRLMGRARALEGMLSAGDFDAVSLAPFEDIRRDSDLFGEMVRSPEAQYLLRAATERGFQTRDAESTLAQMLGELSER